MLVSGASLILHHACADMVFMDVPNSCNHFLQSVSRFFRLDQLNVGNIIILTLDHSYDQSLQAKACIKMIPQIAGQGAVTVTDEMRAKFKLRDPTFAEGMSQESLDDAILLNIYLVLYRRTCRQRSQRYKWIDTYDIRTKDMHIDFERAFTESLDLDPEAIPKGFDPPSQAVKPLLGEIFSVL